MCEIILLYFMGKKIAESANNKGRSGVLFVVMLILLWFGGESSALFSGPFSSGGPGTRCSPFTSVH